jgi:septum formation protein
VALYLSGIKADAYTKPLGDSVLLTADTIVCLGDRIINKPSDEQDAFRMLKDLSGKMHEVFTGVTLKSAGRSHSFYERTEVYFKPLSDAEIGHYIAMCKPFDKAGAYGIQEWIGYIGVRGINGCFYNVMGLPLSRLYQELAEF